MRSRLKDLKNSFRLLNNFLRRHERLPRHIRRPSWLLGLGVGHAAELEHGASAAALLLVTSDHKLLRFHLALQIFQGLAGLRQKHILLQQILLAGLQLDLT